MPLTITDYKGKFVKGIDGNFTYVITEEVRKATDQRREEELDLEDLKDNENYPDFLEEFRKPNG